MRAAHLQPDPIKVSGHLEESRGIYQMVLNWRTPNGGRGRKSISTGLPVKGNKKRAEDMLRIARKEKEAELAHRPDASQITFADFLDNVWLPAVKQTVRLNTYGGYACNVSCVIAPYFREEGTLLRELTAEDINEFYTVQLGRVKAQTIHHYHANISAALKYALEKGYIEHSVMEKVKRPKKEKFVGRFLKQSEAVALFDAVKGHKLELGVILGAFYGLRRSEVVGLRWESIDFEANTITIEHTVTMTRIDGKSVIIAANTTKSESSRRSLPLVPAFRETLLAVKAEQERNQKLCGNCFNHKEARYVYTDALGNRIKPNYLTTAFPDFMEKHGFERLRFHDLRHSCASLLLSSGVPLKMIQDWLGHSEFSITANTYAHLETDSKLQSAQAMTWIDKTAFAQGSAVNTAPQPKQEPTAHSDSDNLLDLVHSLLASGAPVEVVKAWLERSDFISGVDVKDQFMSLLSSLSGDQQGNANCQPT